jgi:hypothetical protein
LQPRDTRPPKETLMLKVPTWLLVAIVATLAILAWIVLHG